MIPDNSSLEFLHHIFEDNEEIVSNLYQAQMEDDYTYIDDCLTDVENTIKILKDSLSNMKNNL